MTKEQRKERSILRIMSTCVHFTGIQHPACKANINYHEQFGDGLGCFANIPCTHMPDEAGIKECPSVQYPTREQAEAEEAEREARNKKSMEAMTLAHSDAKAKGIGKGSGGQSSVKCPLCPEGNIRYSVASINGHMHAGCTSGCVSWME